MHISGKAKLLILALLVVPVVLLSGCLDGDGDGGDIICPAQSGDILCGYCNEDAALSDNPHAGKCRYCPTGYRCSFSDICGDLTCTAGGSDGGDGGGGGGGTTTYYASCSGCDGPYSTYSYRGPSYSVCNGYYQACVIASCDKILDNCR